MLAGSKNYFVVVLLVKVFFPLKLHHFASHFVSREPRSAAGSASHFVVFGVESLPKMAPHLAGNDLNFLPFIFHGIFLRTFFPRFLKTTSKGLKNINSYIK